MSVKKKKTLLNWTGKVARNGRRTVEAESHLIVGKPKWRLEKSDGKGWDASHEYPLPVTTEHYGNLREAKNDCERMARMASDIVMNEGRSPHEAYRRIESEYLRTELLAAQDRLAGAAEIQQRLVKTSNSQRDELLDTKKILATAQRELADAAVAKAASDELVAKTLNDLRRDFDAQHARAASVGDKLVVAQREVTSKDATIARLDDQLNSMENELITLAALYTKALTDRARGQGTLDGMAMYAVQNVDQDNQ